METNDNSYKQAIRVLAATFARSSFTLLQGYSSDQHVADAVRAYHAEHQFTALLQEIIGFIATSEGVASVVGHLKHVIGPAASTLCYVPTVVATFYTLVDVDVKDVYKNASELYVNQPASTLLVR
jgi:hypothetical protein